MKKGIKRFTNGFQYFVSFHLVLVFTKTGYNE